MIDVARYGAFAEGCWFCGEDADAEFRHRPVCLSCLRVMQATKEDCGFVGEEAYQAGVARTIRHGRRNYLRARRNGRAR